MKHLSSQCRVDVGHALELHTCESSTIVDTDNEAVRLHCELWLLR